MAQVDTPVTGGSPNPVGSLTASALPYPENVDWAAFGTSHVPEACQTAWPWQSCTVIGDDAEAGEVPAKPLNDGVDAVDFRPFLIEFNAASCDGLPGDWDMLEARALRGIKINASRVIGQTFSSSSPDGTPNDSPALPTVGVDITPVGGATNLVNTLTGLLQEAVACGLTGDLFIHAPHWTLPHFLNDQLIAQVGSTFRMGPHTVVLDQGYTNEEPTGAVPAATGEAWIYVTGPVEYATGGVAVMEDNTRHVITRQNKADAIAVQNAIYRFDPCCVRAAKAKVC